MKRLLLPILIMSCAWTPVWAEAPASAAPAPATEAKPAPGPKAERKKKADSPLQSSLNKLSPEDRQKALQALRTVWKDPEVSQHRSEFQQSREKYLSSLREAASDLDPEVEKLLKPMIGSIINSQSLDQLIPGEASLSHYLKAVRLTPEQVDGLSDPERERLRAAAPKVLADTRFKSAADSAKNMSPSPERREAAKNLVQLARTITSEIEPELKSLMDSPIVPPKRVAKDGARKPHRPGTEHGPGPHSGPHREKNLTPDAASPPPPANAPAPVAPPQ
jgi:hypothetical protein